MAWSSALCLKKNPLGQREVKALIRKFQYCYMFCLGGEQ